MLNNEVYVLAHKLAQGIASESILFCWGIEYYRFGSSEA